LRTERPETPSEAAMRIARATLDGGYDPLLACRDLWAVSAPLEAQVPGVPLEVLDTFMAIGSEVDGLPLGPESQYWAPTALVERDAEAED
jgi:hypothetical protein